MLIEELTFLFFVGSNSAKLQSPLIVSRDTESCRRVFLNSSQFFSSLKKALTKHGVALVQGQHCSRFPNPDLLSHLRPQRSGHPERVRRRDVPPHDGGQRHPHRRNLSGLGGIYARVDHLLLSPLGRRLHLLDYRQGDSRLDSGGLKKCRPSIEHGSMSPTIDRYCVLSHSLLDRLLELDSSRQS